MMVCACERAGADVCGDWDGRMVGGMVCAKKGGVDVDFFASALGLAAGLRT